MFGMRSYEDGVCAIDPTNGRRMLLSETEAIQGQREPGSIPPFPSRDYEIPKSTQPMFDIGANPRVMPAKTPSALVFYLSPEDGTRGEDPR